MRKRVIPCLFLKNGFIIRSEKFSIHQIIGNPITELRRFSEWSVDEIVYIVISKDESYDFKRDEHRIQIPNDRYDLIREISKNCFVPLGFGGGIRTLKDIEKTLNYGADKVVLNTALFFKKELLESAVRIFGSQSLVACVDYMGPYVFHSFGKVNSGISIFDWCAYLEKEGIGEIILNSIERDGTGNGYDIKTIKTIVDNSSVPIIALGGAGDYYDFVECFELANPSAVAAGNIFHFKEHSDFYIKKSLRESGVNIRKTWED